MSDVLAGGPADRAGIQRGDVIVSFNEKQIDSPAAEARLVAGDIIIEVDLASLTSLQELQRRVEGLAKGAIVLLLVDRGGSTLYITLKIW